MLACVFVYRSSTFKVDSPLVRFEPGPMYEEAAIAIPGGFEGRVEPGIYAIAAEDSDMDPGLWAIDARIAVDFDLLLIRGKDPWPPIVAPEGEVIFDGGRSQRVRTTFPSLRDEDLKRFFMARRI